MRIIIVENDKNPVDLRDIEGKKVVLASELPLAYLQGIRDAEGIDAVLIGSGGKEIQMDKEKTPEYPGVDSIEAAIQLIQDRL